MYLISRELTESMVTELGSSKVKNRIHAFQLSSPEEAESRLLQGSSTRFAIPAQEQCHFNCFTRNYSHLELR